MKVTLSLKRAYNFWCLEFNTIFLFFCKLGVQRMFESSRDILCQLDANSLANAASRSR